MSSQTAEFAAACPTFNRVEEDSPLELASPLRVMFLISSMPVGGAEVLLAELVRRMDPSYFLPEICCLKEPGPLGEELANEIPVHHDFSRANTIYASGHGWYNCCASEGTDAVVTVGAGDKMFWGRLAAKRVGVPVILSALHSTGWPDGVGRLNRALTPITDGFIAVADSHGEHMLVNEGFPAKKSSSFRTASIRTASHRHPTPREFVLKSASAQPTPSCRSSPRRGLKRITSYSCKRRRASSNRYRTPSFSSLATAHAANRSTLAAELGISSSVRFLGTRSDIPQLLSTSDAFALTSHNEANPLSILEAMSVGKPVVATNVGSIKEAVIEGQTGSTEVTALCRPSSENASAARVTSRPATKIRRLSRMVSLRAAAERCARSASSGSVLVQPAIAQKMTKGMMPGHHLPLQLKSPCIRVPAGSGTERKQTLAGLSNPKCREGRNALKLVRLTVSSAVFR